MPTDKHKCELQVGDLVRVDLYTGPSGPGVVLKLHGPHPDFASYGGYAAEVLWLESGDMLSYPATWTIKLEIPSDNH